MRCRERTTNVAKNGNPHHIPSTWKFKWRNWIYKTGKNFPEWFQSQGDGLNNLPETTKIRSSMVYDLIWSLYKNNSFKPHLQLLLFGFFSPTSQDNRDPLHSALINWSSLHFFLFLTLWCQNLYEIKKAFPPERRSFFTVEYSMKPYPSCAFILLLIEGLFSQALGIRTLVLEGTGKCFS